MKILSWLIEIITRLVALTKVGILWVATNYKSRRVWASVGITALILIIGAVGYRVLNPTVLVSPDTGPFDTVEEYEEFVVNNPLITASVPESQKFTKTAQIREDKKLVYTIELSQRPIKPQMDRAYVESYLAYLQESQDEALAWIRSIGQDPEKLSIIWRPNPAEMREKMLGETTKSIPQKESGSTASPTPIPTATSAPRFPQ